MFIAALFIIAKTWKQLKCPSMNEWIKEICYIYIHTHTHTKEYYSAIKKRKLCHLQQHGWTLKVSC